MANDMNILKVIAENGTFSFPVTDQTARDAAATAQSTAQSASQTAADAQQTASSAQSTAQAAKQAAEGITIPTALPNPNKLTFTGGATGTYDGTKAVTINIPTGGEGGGSSPVQYVESLDESNLANLRDLATGTYVLYGYFLPHPGAADTMTCDNTLASVAQLSAGSHVLVFNPLNCKVNFLEILVDESAESGFTYSVQIIDMRDLPALIAAVGSRDDLATEDKSSIVAAINEVAANAGSSDSSQNVDFSVLTLGYHTDGLVYIFANGVPVGNGIKISGGTGTTDVITVADGVMTISALAKEPTQNEGVLNIK